MTMKDFELTRPNLYSLKELVLTDDIYIYQRRKQNYDKVSFFL